MPPAGESAVAATGTPATGATARPGAPDVRTLRPHYPCLEGLRTIGVMALFFQHTGFTTGLQLRPGFSWMGHLELGPTMFFVLSAFLLYQPFATANLADRAAQSFGRFIKGRAFRVIPAYWVTLVLLILFFRADCTFICPALVTRQCIEAQADVCVSRSREPHEAGSYRY